MRNLRWYQRSGEQGTWTTWRSIPTQTFVATANYQYYILDAMFRRESYRRSVASNDDQLSLARSKRLKRRLVAQGDLSRLHDKRQARGEGV
jgi:hypothetical protein